MKMDEIQYTFQVCSYLLSYPNEQFYKSLTKVKKDVEQMETKELRTMLINFINKALRQSQNDLINNFVYTFDFGRKTNLYITYMTSGEQRERGIDLLYLKNYYQMHGFSITDTELPDFLPLMLEFAAQVNEEIRKPIFGKYFDNIKEIADRLKVNNNLYHHVLQAIMLALQKSGISKSVRRSEDLCLNNSCG